MRTKLFRPTLSHLHDRNEQKTEEAREEIAQQKKAADEARRADAEGKWFVLGHFSHAFANFQNL